MESDNTSYVFRWSALHFELMNYFDYSVTVFWKLFPVCLELEDTDIDFSILSEILHPTSNFELWFIISRMAFVAKFVSLV